MNIKLENQYLAPAINFLQQLKLKNSQSRARSKLVKLLTKQVEELQESEMALIEEFGVLGEDGKPIYSDGGYTIDTQKHDAYRIAANQLHGEQAEIIGGTYVSHLGELLTILNEYEGELEGIDAQVYDILLDAFEEAVNNENLEV